MKDKELKEYKQKIESYLQDYINQTISKVRLETGYELVTVDCYLKNTVSHIYNEKTKQCDYTIKDSTCQHVHIDITKDI